MIPAAGALLYSVGRSFVHCFDQEVHGTAPKGIDPSSVLLNCIGKLCEFHYFGTKYDDFSFMQGYLGISSGQIQQIISQTSAGEPAILASGFLESTVITGRFVLCRLELSGIHLCHKSLCTEVFTVQTHL